MSSMQSQRRPRTAALFVLILVLTTVSAAKTKNKDLNDSAIAQVAEDIVQHSVFAGKIQPVLASFVITKTKGYEIIKNVLKGTRRGDLTFLVALGWGLVPAVEYPYNKLYPPPVGPELPEPQDFKPIEVMVVQEPERRRFRDTILFQIVDHVSQVAKIAVGVYAVDVLEIVLCTMGISGKRVDAMSSIFAKTAYTVWGAWRFKIFKRYLIANAVQCKPDKLGRAKIFDQFLDVLIAGTTGFLLLDILSVETGMAVKSLFAFGSAGTLVFSLASKDVASHVVSAFALGASDKFYEGDEVRFSDGTAGVVENMGWMETTIRTPDELTIAVPNSHLANQHVVNLSRAKKSKVQQTLRFHYKDVDKLDTVLQDILEEIKESCPSVITDGSRPFDAHWSDYKDQYLEVTVHCHFDIQPTGSAYWENKQNMLQAIDRAVRKNDIEFYA